MIAIGVGGVGESVATEAIVNRLRSWLEGGSTIIADIKLAAHAIVSSFAA